MYNYETVIIPKIVILKPCMPYDLDQQPSKNYQKLIQETVNSSPFIIKFPYNARSDWLKQRALSENRARVDDSKLASKILLRNFDKFDPN